MVKVDKNVFSFYHFHLICILDFPRLLFQLIIRRTNFSLFAGLDVLRVLIRSYEMSLHFVNNGDELIQYLLKVIGYVYVCSSSCEYGVCIQITASVVKLILFIPFCSSEKTKNHDVTTGIVFRIFSNLFLHEKGKIVMSKQGEEVRIRISS